MCRIIDLISESPKTKQDLLDGIQNGAQTALTWFDAIPADAFFTRSGEAWSASDNVDHLIRAIRPVALALKMPKVGLQVAFGTSVPDVRTGEGEPTSRSYDEICRIYEAAIAQGGQASGVFLPDQKVPVDVEAQKQQLLEKLNKASESLLDALAKWDEAELDRYQLPHPLLGKLTVREMLFFSIYHLFRHARVEGD